MLCFVNVTLHAVYILYQCCIHTGGGEQRFIGRPGGGAQHQQQYRPQLHQQTRMEGVASMEQDNDIYNEGVIMVSLCIIYPNIITTCDWLATLIVSCSEKSLLFNSNVSLSDMILILMHLTYQTCTTMRVSYNL